MDDDKWLAIAFIGIIGFCVLGAIFAPDDSPQDKCIKHAKDAEMLKICKEMK